MPSEEPKSYFKLGLVVLLLILLVILSSFIIRPQTPPKPLITPGFIQGINLTSTFEFIFKSEGLSKIVQKNLQGKEGHFAIYIEDLPTSPVGGNDTENYTMNSLDTFPAASLYKVYLLAAVLKQVDEGDLAMDDTLSASLDYLTQVYGGLDFGYDPSTGSGQGEKIEYTVEEALTRVGRISDNFAAIMLADQIGWGKIQKMADSLGAKNTVIKTPISTSAEDIALFFKKLYLREIVSPQVSEEVIKYLSLNQLNDRIPAKITSPNISNPSIIHKTGELSRVRHDAGIVILSQQPEQPQLAYVIVLMSKDLKYEDSGVETLANISKEVYEYFKNKK